MSKIRRRTIQNVMAFSQYKRTLDSWPVKIILGKNKWKSTKLPAVFLLSVTLMPVYHSHKPVLLGKRSLLVIASSLLQAIKTCPQACSTK